MRRSPYKSQRGAAIIIALFVMSLVAAAAVAMIVRSHIDIRRTELLLNANRANLYAQGSIAWAMDTLINNWKQRKPAHIVDATPIHSKTDNMDGFQISSTIEDAQAYFNVNNLSNQEYQDNFIHLLQITDPALQPATVKNIISSIRDWISPVVKNSGYDNYYAGLNPPYRAPHRRMASISELRLVKDMTPTLFNKLAPYLTALPDVTAININNAPAPVLMSLSPTMTLEAAQSLALYRTSNLFQTPKQFLDFDIVKNNPIPANKITIISNYFLVKTNVTVGQQSIILYTLLVRVAQDAKPTVTVLWQTKGTL